MRSVVSVMVAVLVATVLSAVPAGAMDDPQVECRVSVDGRSVTYTVTTRNLPARTKTPLNMKRVDANGDEVFVFLGTKRSSNVLRADGSNTTQHTIEIRDDVAPGRFDFFARYRLSNGTKGPRVLCATNEIVGIADDFPDGVEGNVHQANDAAGCWAAGYEEEEGLGETTVVSLTGNIGTSQNLRGNGRWLQKMRRTTEDTASTVDTAILRGGNLPGKQTIPCERGWTGDVELFAPEGPDDRVIVEGEASFMYDGDRYLIWTQTLRCAGICLEERVHITNLATGDVAEVTDGLSPSDGHVPMLHACDGRFVEMRAFSLDEDEIPKSVIVDVKTAEVVATLRYDEQVGRQGFDCDGNFWFEPIDFVGESSARYLVLPD